MAAAAVAVAVVVAALFFQRVTIAGAVNVNFSTEEWVQDVRDLDEVVTIDEVTANQVPKLKTLMARAYETRNDKYGGGHADAEITDFDYNAIKAVSEKNELAAESFRQHDDFIAKYDGQYYSISVIRR